MDANRPELRGEVAFPGILHQRGKRLLQGFEPGNAHAPKAPQAVFVVGGKSLKGVIAAAMGVAGPCPN